MGLAEGVVGRDGCDGMGWGALGSMLMNRKVSGQWRTELQWPSRQPFAEARAPP